MPDTLGFEFTGDEAAEARAAAAPARKKKRSIVALAPDVLARRNGRAKRTDAPRERKAPQKRARTAASAGSGAAGASATAHGAAGAAGGRAERLGRARGARGDSAEDTGAERAAHFSGGVGAVTAGAQEAGEGLVEVGDVAQDSAPVENAAAEPCEPVSPREEGPVGSGNEEKLDCGVDGCPPLRAAAVELCEPTPPRDVMPVSSNGSELGDCDGDVFPVATSVVEPRGPTPPKQSHSTAPTELPEVRPAPRRRVRFSEPPRPFGVKSSRVGLLNAARLRRRSRSRLVPSAADVSVAASGGGGADEKQERVLLDELQYVLDGVFKPVGEHTHVRSRAVDDDLITTSMLSLLALLLRRPPASSSPTSLLEENAAADEGHVSEILLILRRQPKVLRTIIERLLGLQGRTKSIDLLLATVVLTLVKAQGNAALFQCKDVEALVEAYFRNTVALIKSAGQNSCNDTPSAGGTSSYEQKPAPRRRGRAGRRAEAGRAANNVMSKVASLTVEGGLVDATFLSKVENETEGAAILSGIALAGVLEGDNRTRLFIRDDRRLDRLVAILFGAEHSLRGGPKRVAACSAGTDPEKTSLILENGRAHAIAAVSMSVLEFVTLDSLCQERIVNDSKLVSSIVQIMREVHRCGTMVDSEILLASALKLLINLTHNCAVGLKQFIQNGGMQVVVDCLAMESRVFSHKGPLVSPPAESFDIRVLCLALLASIVDQGPGVRESFREIYPAGVEEREGGAVTFVLELLKCAGDTGDTDESCRDGRRKEISASADMFDGDGALGVKVAGTDLGFAAQDKVSDADTPSGDMEKKVTIGYLCLVIGALVKNSAVNRELIAQAMPDNSLAAIAEVLDEFLEFHHEVGVTSASVDGMYDSIINALRTPTAVAVVSPVAN